MRDHVFSIACIELRGMPTGWRWCSWSCAKEHAPDGYHRITGAVPIGVITKGKSKGRPKWPKELQTHFISQQEIDALILDLEKRRGHCWECRGFGKEQCRIPAIDDSSFRTCGRCKGTGVGPGCEPGLSTPKSIELPAFYQQSKIVQRTLGDM